MADARELPDPSGSAAELAAIDPSGSAAERAAGDQSGPAHGIWVLRHGESVANVEGVIVSAVGPRALIEVGLTERGRRQARDAARKAEGRGIGPEVVVLTSDFARAHQTAQEFCDALGAHEPRLDERLRERGFGTHDEGPASAYDLVWADDLARRESAQEVEPVSEVALRACEVLRDADRIARCAPVVLVAHGDVLQIMLAVGEGMDPYEHRSVPHLGNAELRRVGPGRDPSGAGVTGMGAEASSTTAAVGVSTGVAGTGSDPE